MHAIALLILLLQQPAVTALHVPELSAPTLVALPSTEAETTAIRAGITLNDQGRFDEAIARYQEVLQANPECAGALYELAFTQSQKKDYQGAIDTAVQGIKFESPVLPQFWGLIGSTFDSAGDHQKAIEIYQKGIALLPAAGTLYYNLGVTYSTGLKDVANARTAFRRGAIADPTHAGVQFQLGTIYYASGLRAAALLAVSRFLILEPGSARSATYYALWRQLLNGNPISVPANMPSAVTLSPDQKKEEGDLPEMDQAIVIHKAASQAMGQVLSASEIQVLASQVTGLLSSYGKLDPPASEIEKSSMLRSYYLPYFTEMQQKDYVEPFVYFINQRAGLPGVSDWLNAHTDRVREFLEWSRNYRWPKP